MEGTTNNPLLMMMMNGRIEADEFFAALPPGFRFVPTDRELILHYLSKKVVNEPLPPNRIHSVNIYQHHPQELAERFPRVREIDWYFFTSRNRKYLNGNRPNRSASGGFWKAVGSDYKIKNLNGEVIGYKRILDFLGGTHKENYKTDWKMAEYRLKDEKLKKEIPCPKRKKGDEDSMKLDNFVLCRVYINTKKAGTNSSTENSDQGVPYTGILESDDIVDEPLLPHEGEAESLESSLMWGSHPDQFLNASGGSNNKRHKSSSCSSSTILNNGFFPSPLMNASTHYDESLQNHGFGSANQWGYNNSFHNQKSDNMYLESMLSYCKPVSSPFPLQYAGEIWPATPDMVDMSVPLPCRVQAYEFTPGPKKMPTDLHVEDEDDDLVQQFLNFEEDAPETIEVQENDCRKDVGYDRTKFEI